MIKRLPFHAGRGMGNVAHNLCSAVTKSSRHTHGEGFDGMHGSSPPDGTPSARRAECMGEFRVLSSSGRSKWLPGDSQDDMESRNEFEAAVPLWRGKQELADKIKGLVLDEREGRLKGCSLLRVETRVTGIGVEEAILWLRAQPDMTRSFFLNPDSSLLSAGAGAAHIVKGARELKSALLPEGAPPCFRYYGGSRFDSGAVVGEEWSHFGGHFFLLPRLELVSSTRGSGNGVGETSRSGRNIGDSMLKQGFTLAVNIRVDSNTPGGWGRELAQAAQAVDDMEVPWGSGSPMNTPLPSCLPPASSMCDGTSYEHWAESVENALSQMREGRLRKVVLARNYLVHFDVDVEPLDLLLQLQSHHGYLFCLQPSKGSAFLGCSPEPLFRISPDCIQTMAIAGTRPRGNNPEEDLALEKELMQSRKDSLENEVTAEYIQQQLAALATDVVVSDVFVMKLRHVQHLARRIRAKPLSTISGGESASVSTPIGLLLSLNPTPAVCGESRPVATEFIRSQESFDRGFYGGPVGFVSSTVCEFCVAIRSVLCQPRKLHVFAGAGMVPGSGPLDEWNETAMKMRNVLQLISSSPCVPLVDQPNINTLWASMLVEELIRCGVDHFCVCPGSRSTPLAVAIARNPRASSRIFHDERSAGFYCVGHARGCGRAAACVVTSGTAVANLLPAVVESSQAGVPMLLLTADRPPELRDVGSNQTINQPGIFGGYTRWAKDVSCPTDEIPASAMLSDIDYAVHCSHSGTAGPVHLNLMYRENLAPDAGPPRGGDAPGGSGKSGAWERGCLASWRLSAWERCSDPLTRYARVGPSATLPSGLIDCLLSARRGVVIAGTLLSQCDRTAAAWVASELGWPILSDVQSGLHFDQCGVGFSGVPFIDQMLCEGLVAQNLRPDVVLQLGERVVSARLSALTQSAIHAGTSQLIIVSAAPGRQDPLMAATSYVATSPAMFACALGERLPPGRRERGRNGLAEGMMKASVAVQGSQHKFMHLARALDEPYVAYRTTTDLREGSALFLSASMPVRDVDMFMNPAAKHPTVHIASNRGASGIDGVLSTALGYSTGTRRPVTLLIGDVAALHDLSALACLNEAPHPMCIVIVNNGGCGIFSFLPISGHGDVFPRFFDHPHAVEFGGVSKMFGIEYRRATTREEFDGCLVEAQASETRHYVIEAIVPGSGSDNVRLHRELGAMAATAVRREIDESISLSWAWEGDTRLPVCVLLHGWMGCKEDWAGPVIDAVHSAGWSSLSIDLPGHGGSLPTGKGAWMPSVALSADYAVEAIVNLLKRLGIVKDGEGAVALVGYSMGGRVAMRLMEKLGEGVAACVIVGAHPGIEEGGGAAATGEAKSGARRARMVSDESTATSLRACSTADAPHDVSQVDAGGDDAGSCRKPEFSAWLNRWYSQPLFAGVSKSRGFNDMLERRRMGDPLLLSEALLGHSLARQPSMWSKLSSGGTPLLYIAGGGDAKYREIMERLVSQSAAAAAGRGGGGSKGEGREYVSVRGEIVDGVGHAVLEEAPEKLSTLIGSFLSTASQNNLEVGGSRKIGRLGACLGADDGGDGSCMICSVSVTRFSVPLTVPLQLSKGDALTRREGALVEINTMAGDTGYGECTPLPGFHPESLTEVTRQLEVLSKRLVGRIIPKHVSRLDGSFQKWLSAEAGSVESFAQWHVGEGAGANHGDDTGHELAKVVVAALEAAVVGVIADAEGVAVSAVISAGAGCPLRSHLLLNGLATRSEGGSVSGGFAVYKIKVGGMEGVEADAKRLAGFEDVAGTTRLRLDANQAWSLEDAVRFVSLLSPAVKDMIEYIEEPLNDPHRLVEFYNRTGMRYALDESIDQGRVPDLTAAGVVSCQGFAAAVVKPSVLGGVERSRQLLGGIREGAKAGFDVVVSSAFETSLGLAHLAACAGGLNPATGADCARGVAAAAAAGGGGSGVAHGLGTYGRLGGELVVADGGLGSCVREGGRLDVLACEAMVKDSRHKLSVVLKAAQEN